MMADRRHRIEATTWRNAAALCRHEVPSLRP
jgi:hypothetical protein